MTDLEVTLLWIALVTSILGIYFTLLKWAKENPRNDE